MTFNEITFAGEVLTIVPVVGENVDYNLSTAPIRIKVESSEAVNGVWKVFVDTSTPTPGEMSKLYISSIPFGEVGGLAKLKFGRIDSMATFKIRTLRTSSIKDDHTLAVVPAFYMVIIGESKNEYDDTIGTDDMRNGMANINVFSLEGENNIYLKLVKNGDKYNLEVGYEKNP